MAFTCNLYKISDPPATLHKDITSNGKLIRENISCSPFEPMGDLRGQIIIDYSFNADSANYCSITESSGGETPVIRTRYAFITDRIKGVGGRLTLVLDEDPLMTFKAGILEADILATRASVLAKDSGNVGYNAYLPDGFWKCDATHLYWLSDDIMGGFFNYDEMANEFMLMTAG